jgi:hypothetical protein
MELLGQILPFLGSERVGRAAAGEETRRIDPQAPRKKYDDHSPREVMESKTQ